MMNELPVLKTRVLLAFLQKLGFRQVSQKGSHIKLALDGKLVIVPNHDEVRRGTLASIIRQTRLTRQEFLRLLKN